MVRCRLLSRNDLTENDAPFLEISHLVLGHDPEVLAKDQMEAKRRHAVLLDLLGQRGEPFPSRLTLALTRAPTGSRPRSARLAASGNRRAERDVRRFPTDVADESTVTSRRSRASR